MKALSQFKLSTVGRGKINDDIKKGMYPILQ
jgi:hypothetical protein